MPKIRRLNHAVLYVTDAAVSATFYQDVLGFEVVSSANDGAAVFLRGGGSDNHHDLGLFSVGTTKSPPPPGPRPGLYHLAWELATIDELAELRQTLLDVGALVGESDHGVSKSLYAKDPDGIEFEVLWTVPREDWGRYAKDAAVMPLDLAAELERYGSSA